MGASDDKRLLSVASSISDGAHVDWGRVQEQSGDAHGTVVLREMALLEQIASFHRTSESSGTPTHEGHAQKADRVDPQTWSHFSILEKIGEGTFGTVYRARDTKLQSDVALKLLWPDPVDGHAHPSRALKEARLLARVRHPNVVTVYGTDHVDGRVGIWMEFVKGRTLANLLRAQGPFGAREAALVGFDLCRALAAVDRAGLLHGDVKAHNVMREEGGRTVLMDFGTGKDLETDRRSEQEPFDDFAGTPVYLAPEVFAGERRTKVADLYSLGVLLYHLVTGAYPVDGRTREEVEQAHKRHERRYLRDVRPDLPEEFVRAIERGLAADPRERYQSAGAFEAALARFLGRTDVDHVPMPRRWTVLAASIAALAIAGGAAYWLAPQWIPGNRARDAGSPSADRVAASPSPAPAFDAEPAYQIDTAVYRVREAGEDRLRPGARVGPGDKLFAKVRVSVPAYVYIVNEDDLGESFLLFPLPGQKLTNPLPAGATNRIPSAEGDRELTWQVTTAGGREHFLIFASPERLPVFEQMFAALPRPEFGKPIQNARLSEATVSRLRGVGGLSASPARAGTGRLTLQFPAPLGEREETARGLWVRQLTLDNPAK